MQLLAWEKPVPGKLSELVRTYSAPYIKRLTATPADAREYAALVDFHIKVAVTFLAAYGRRSPVPIKLGPTAGVGEMLSGIREAKKWGASPIHVIVELHSFANAFLGEFSKNIHDGKTFKAIRDQLSHGTPLPVDETSAATICNALRIFSESTAACLDALLEKFSYATTTSSIAAMFGADVQELSPVWNFNAQHGVIGIYSTFDTDGVYYLCPTFGVYSNPQPANTQAFRDGFLGKDPAAKHFGQFVYEITRDVAGFSEDHSAPPYDFGEGQHEGVVFITWTQPTTGGNVHRTDRFRRGLDNRFEWFDLTSATWIGYSQFLRSISNWAVLARRVRLELDEQESRRLVAESGTSHVSPGMKIPAVLVEEADSEAAPPEQMNLQERADSACLPSKSVTTVFFVVADAGMGKTDLLLTAARARAQVIESDPSSDLPLYLYVSSAGRALSNLDDAINTSLSITRIIDVHSAKALCRNGLLVLVVDGFDELLGNSGYDNPLGSLSTWFKDLHGHGVMIASARSAYYMTRYRRALSEKTDLYVTHTVANIQPWTREDIKLFLKSYGVGEDALEPLTTRDWHLLTIPFFAKAFARWQIGRSNASIEDRGIFLVVVEEYLERESTKILDNNGKPILSTPELQLLFSEFAEMMHLDGKRELDQADLELCASYALGINELDKDRPGLRLRLTSLCGMAAGELVSGGSKFSFSHEVIADCFLSLALQRRCRDQVDKAYVVNFFSKGAVHPAVIEWFVAGNVEAARSALTLLLPIENKSTFWKKNLGSLWAALLDEGDGLPPHLSASGLEFQTIKITKGQGATVAMRDATIGSLFLERTAAVLDVKNAAIKHLKVDDDSSLRLLRNIAPEMVQVIDSPNSYSDTTADIRTTLEANGVIARSATGASQDWHDTANYFVQAMVTRPDTPIVLFRDDLSNDERKLAWTHRLGAAKWSEFVDRLTRAGLVKRTQIVSKDRPKIRLDFHVSPAEIARRDGDPRVEAFWDDK
jgi:hypothetical protein